MTRTMLRIAALVLCLMTVVAGTATATPQGVSLSLFSHVCKVIGSDQYDNEGVACADLYVGQSGTAEYLKAENEIFCQDASNKIVDCGGIQETVDTCFNDGSGCPDSKSGTCGTIWGHSDCGARRVENYSYLYRFDPCYPDGWADALDTDILLPRSGKEIGGLDTNVASAHFGAGCNAGIPNAGAGDVATSPASARVTLSRINVRR